MSEISSAKPPEDSGTEKQPQKTEAAANAGKKAKARRGSAVFASRTRNSIGTLYAWPMGAWFSLFFVVPLLIIMLYSFLRKGLYGGVEYKFTFDAYVKMCNFSYFKVFLRTLYISAISTLITIFIALPCGYAMARSRHQTVFLFMVIIPFWTNSLIRIFAWMSILGNEGFINQLLHLLGLTENYLKLLYNQQAVILVSVYMYLPYAILPIFTAICKVLLPNIRSGIVTALIFTFIPIFGAYTVPLLVGGKDSYMIGNIIVDQVNKTRNWPLASAFAMVITVVSTAGVLWMMSSSKKEATLKTKADGDARQ